jgi:hypothetical protein
MSSQEFEVRGSNLNQRDRNFDIDDNSKQRTSKLNRTHGNSIDYDML